MNLRSRLFRFPHMLHPRAAGPRHATFTRAADPYSLHAPIDREGFDGHRRRDAWKQVRLGYGLNLIFVGLAPNVGACGGMTIGIRASLGGAPDSRRNQLPPVGALH